MIVDKIITSTQLANVNVVGVTLLAEDEYEQYVNAIPPVHETWWMRSAGLHDTEADIVMGDGTFLRYGFSVTYIFGVRPVLLLVDSPFEVGNKFYCKDKRWTVISDDMAICDTIVDKYYFNKDITGDKPNDYGTSDIKKFVESWWNK